MTKIALVDPDLSGAEELAARLRERGVALESFTEPLRALVHLGRVRADAVVLAARAGAATATQVTSVVRDELNLPVLLAHDAADVDLIGSPVLAGARPLVGLPYDADQLERVLKEVCPPTPSAEQVRVGTLRLDPSGFGARLDGHGLDLSVLEFEVLLVLAEQPDHVVRRAALMSRWPESADPDERLVAVVSRLRRKLERIGRSGVIHTVRGLGYRLESRALSPMVGRQRDSSMSAISSPTRNVMSSMICVTSTSERPRGSAIGQSR